MSIKNRYCCNIKQSRAGATESFVSHHVSFTIMVSIENDGHSFLKISSLLVCFMIPGIDILIAILYNVSMRDDSFFTQPVIDWQKRYEALRAVFVDRLPGSVVAERFGYSPGYIRVLCHQFRTGKIDFSEPVPEGKVKRRRISVEVRQKIINWREQRLSAGDITELLNEESIEISIRTVERILAEEGFPKLPRRTRLKIGLTVKQAQVPERSEPIHLSSIDGCRWESPGAGVFLFAPFLAKFNIDGLVKS